MKQVFQYFIFILFLSIPTTHTHCTEKNWTLLIYMDGMHELHDAALRNLNDLAHGISGDSATIAIQMHAYNDVAWRYIVEHNTIIQQECVTLTGNYIDDIFSAAQWAYFQNPAQHHGLIFWGHGHGILLPSWDEENNDWFCEFDTALIGSTCSTCPIKRTPATDVCKKNHRSTLAKKANLLNYEKHYYLDNTEMTSLLHEIRYSLLDGKKIDIFCLDVCLGASVEHAYQVAPFVDYFVAVQNCELKDGFAYYALAQSLSQAEILPQMLVKNMINDYNNYYEFRAEKGEYTLSATDCNKIDVLKNALDSVALNLCECIQQEPELRIMIREAIEYTCPQFCFIPMYRDTWTLLNIIQNTLNNNDIKTLDKQTLESTNTSLDKAKEALNTAVIAHTHGYAMHYAHGLTLYCPCYNIDSSYYTAPFAQNSKWLSFITVLTNKSYGE